MSAQRETTIRYPVSDWGSEELAEQVSAFNGAMASVDYDRAAAQDVIAAAPSSDDDTATIVAAVTAARQSLCDCDRRELSLLDTLDALHATATAACTAWCDAKRADAVAREGVIDAALSAIGITHPNAKTACYRADDTWISLRQDSARTALGARPLGFQDTADGRKAQLAARIAAVLG